MPPLSRPQPKQPHSPDAGAVCQSKVAPTPPTRVVHLICQGPEQSLPQQTRANTAWAVGGRGLAGEHSTRRGVQLLSYVLPSPGHPSLLPPRCPPSAQPMAACLHWDKSTPPPPYHKWSPSTTHQGGPYSLPHSRISCVQLQGPTPATVLMATATPSPGALSLTQSPP